MLDGRERGRILRLEEVSDKLRTHELQRRRHQMHGGVAPASWPAVPVVAVRFVSGGGTFDRSASVNQRYGRASRPTGESIEGSLAVRRAARSGHPGARRLEETGRLRRVKRRLALLSQAP